MFPDSLVIVREDEPSSIIAFTLSSIEYKAKLDLMYNNVGNSTTTTTNDTSVSDGVNLELYSMPTEDSKSVKFESQPKSSDIEQVLLKGAGTHIKYQFADGGTRLHCKIFFTEQFDALRRYCECDEAFIESLTRCHKWESMGGKSGSTFLKTRGIFNLKPR